MDNCEHLLDACSDLVHEVLTRCPEINVVATSEARSLYQASWCIGCRHWSCWSSELILIYASCSGWKPSSSSWRRAWLTVPPFKLNIKTAGPVAEICRRLDGIPLALELAAARLAHFTVNELADRLDDALTLLGQRLRGRLDRQQALAATRLEPRAA